MRANETHSTSSQLINGVRASFAANA